LAASGKRVILDGDGLRSGCWLGGLSALAKIDNTLLQMLAQRPPGVGQNRQYFVSSISAESFNDAELSLEAEVVELG